MIEKLLEYQKLDKRRLDILRAVELGRVKQEINASNRAIEDSKANILRLDDDAKNLKISYDNTEKTMRDLMDKVKKFEPKPHATEDENTAMVETATTNLQRLNALETSLENLGKSISQKTRMFEDAKNAVVRAQTTIKNLQPQYEKQLAQIKPQLDEIERDMAKIAPQIDKTLLERYRAKRKTEPAYKSTDIVVPLMHNRCGGCNIEMPLSMIHQITTNGYIVCEECGKIVYKG